MASMSSSRMIELDGRVDEARVERLVVERAIAEVEHADREAERASDGGARRRLATTGRPVKEKAALIGYAAIDVVLLRS
jgi:hypothetical protein